MEGVGGLAGTLGLLLSMRQELASRSAIIDSSEVAFSDTVKGVAEAVQRKAQAIRVAVGQYVDIWNYVIDGQNAVIMKTAERTIMSGTSGVG